MIDWSRIRELDQQLGRDDLVEIFDLFVEETAPIVTRLGAALTPDPEDLHFVKGSASNLGLEHLAQLCRRGELALRNHTPFDTGALEDSFRTGCDTLRARLSGSL
ncbi:Hpt domain-containing protein [Maribius pontilimi]|uniref:Hpt domain-containing protein n=1 Tax=Palleronia pontilimi TaxID=1964209 RepID=A0A934IET8_9RHOB|nr:Hpt domain-containing protein [Palleronia pontilimi]MBJ3761563.1 Hpt domain-containing protein [Palleronia pontilimi]